MEGMHACTFFKKLNLTFAALVISFTFSSWLWLIFKCFLTSLLSSFIYPAFTLSKGFFHSSLVLVQIRRNSEKRVTGCCSHELKMTTTIQVFLTDKSVFLESFQSNMNLPHLHCLYMASCFPLEKYSHGWCSTQDSLPSLSFLVANVWVLFFSCLQQPFLTYVFSQGPSPPIPPHQAKGEW
jgi:hypothetical protein